MKQLFRISRRCLLLAVFMFIAGHAVFIVQGGWHWKAATKFETDYFYWLDAFYSVWLVLFTVSCYELMQYFRGKGKRLKQKYDDLQGMFEIVQDGWSKGTVMYLELCAKHREASRKANLWDITSANTRAWVDKYFTQKDRAELLQGEVDELKLKLEENEAAYDLADFKLNAIIESLKHENQSLDARNSNTGIWLTTLLKKIPDADEPAPVCTITPGKGRKHGSNKGADKKN